MIGLDTNVLVRYFAQDDAIQSPLANRVIEALTAEAPGFVSTVVLAELVWVMQGPYAAGKAQTIDIMEQLLKTREILVQKATAVHKSLLRYKSTNAGFADCLIECIGESTGCSATVTFDRMAARHAGMRLLSPS